MHLQEGLLCRYRMEQTLYLDVFYTAVDAVSMMSHPLSCSVKEMFSSDGFWSLHLPLSFEKAK